MKVHASAFRLFSELENARSGLVSIRKPLLGALVGISLLLGAVGLLSKHYHQEFSDASRGVLSAREAIDTLHSLMSHVTDLETGQRGYLLTGQEKHLEPRARSARLVGAELRALKRLLTDDPVQGDRIAALEKLVERKLNGLKVAVDSARKAGRDAALDHEAIDAGQSLLLDIRVRVEQLIDAEKAILQARRGRFAQVQERVVLLAGLGTALAFVLLVVAAWFAFREIARRNLALQDAQAARREAEEVVVRARLSRAEAIKERDNAVAADLAKGQFLAGAAHDLRQPLSIIQLTLATVDRLEPGRHRQLLQPAGRAVQMLDRTLGQLIEARRLSAGVWTPHPQAIDVRELLESICEAYQPIAERADLSFRCRPVACWIYSDKAMLERILTNLVLNAIRYTEKGGLLLAARRRGDEALIQVWDTGVGIARKEFATMFQEFGRVGKHRKEGIGLGLFVSGQMSRALGTELRVASRPGQGSCFSIALPAVPPPELAAVQRRAN